MAAVLFAAYFALSVQRHRRMESTGYDLGLFEQAVRNYAHLRAPVADFKSPGYNLLGDHFHPVLVTIAPLYRLYPGPVTLLIVQAGLLAVSAVPVTRLAAESHGPRAGACIGLAYGLSWGIQQAVVFDFHEVAFAVPVVARVTELLVRRQAWAAARWALLLPLVKEDMALIVVAVGAHLYRTGDRKAGAVVTGVAVAAAALTVLVIIPAFNPDHSYNYFGVAQNGPENPFTRLFTPVGMKGNTLFALFAATLFLALRSPLALLTLPTLLARFWASNPFLWGTHFHYSAVLMPIVFIAALDGLDRLRRPGTGTLGRRIATAAPLAVLAAGTVPVALGAQPLGRLLRPSYAHVPPDVAEARRILAVIPDGADVAAANRLAPQLTARCRVLRLDPVFLARRPRWAAVALPGRAGPPPPREEVAVQGLAASGYRPVARGGGIMLYRR